MPKSVFDSLYPGGLPADLLAPPPFLQDVFDRNDIVEAMFWYRTFQDFLRTMRLGDKEQMDNFLLDLANQGRRIEADQMREHAARYLKYVQDNPPAATVAMLVVIEEQSE